MRQGAVSSAEMDTSPSPNSPIETPVIALSKRTAKRREGVLPAHPQLFLKVLPSYPCPPPSQDLRPSVLCHTWRVMLSSKLKALSAMSSGKRYSIRAWNVASTVDPAKTGKGKAPCSLQLLMCSINVGLLLLQRAGLVWEYTP